MFSTTPFPGFKDLIFATHEFNLKHVVDVKLSIRKNYHLQNYHDKNIHKMKFIER